MIYKNSNYKDSGVDIKSGDLTVKKIAEYAKTTFNENVLTGIGHFGSFYMPDLKNYNEPVLVSSVDGVGTKLKIAIMMDIHYTIGQDLVNHCVNDIAVCGAKPLYFLDYMAFGKLDPEIASEIVRGFAIACRENGIALVGGETAEMPGLYSLEDYDLSGTIVGVVDKKDIIDGKNIEKGNIIIGVESNGLHTNGYSLARKVLLSKYTLSDSPEEIENTIGEELLKIHKSYLKLISFITARKLASGFAHITGGGLINNTMRIIPDGLKLEVVWENMDTPGIFRLIQKLGNVDIEEMRNVFNMGIGLVILAHEKNVDEIISVCNELNEKVTVLGKVI